AGGNFLFFPMRKTPIAFTFRQDLVFAQRHSIDSKESAVVPQKECMGVVTRRVKGKICLRGENSRYRMDPRKFYQEETLERGRSSFSACMFLSQRGRGCRCKRPMPSDYRPAG